MALVRRRNQQQAAPLARLQDEVNDLFGRFFDDWPLAGLSRAGSWFPALDISEREDSVVVQAEIPGMKRDDIDISVQDNHLTISGEKKESEEHKEGEYYHSERRYGTFRREIPLPAGVDADNVDATYRDGVLTVTLPKSEEAKPRKIEIKS
ncbi:MAG: Hsp20/alpha crystallin family protein [Phycisphaerae bacterium]